MSRPDAARRATAANDPAESELLPWWSRYVTGAAASVALAVVAFVAWLMTL